MSTQFFSFFIFRFTKIVFLQNILIFVPHNYRIEFIRILALTKAIARHGLGLYIYAGEDLPEDDPDAKPKEKKAAEPATEEPTDRIKAAKTWTAQGIDTNFVLKLYGVKSLSEMTPDMITNALNNLDKIIAKQKGQTK